MKPDIMRPRTLMATMCRAMDALVAQLSATRNLTSTWLIVDFDAFFASVEELSDPSLVWPCLTVLAANHFCTMSGWQSLHLTTGKQPGSSSYTASSSGTAAACCKC